MGTTDNPTSEKITAFRLRRPDCPGWMFVGTTPAEAADAVRNELENEDGLPADERGSIILEPYTTTQPEIDALPEFEGW